MIKKEDIKKWLEENNPLYAINSNEDLSYMIHDCITELGQDKWVSEDAPIELEEGCWYMCEMHDKCQMPLFWDGKGAADHITRSGGTTGSYHERIKPLYKMERAK